MNSASIRHKLRQLTTSADRHCLSIYLPVLQGEQIGRQNPIRLKNLLASAAESLVARGLRATDARDLIESIREATRQPDFWEDGSRGLAIFGNSERVSVLRLPQTVAEAWIVGPHFHITPLLEFENSGSFVVLAVGKNSCRAFRGDRWSIQPVDVAELPAAEKDALLAADHQRTAEMHGGVRHGSTRQTVYTGQGGASDHAKPEFTAYCRQIDKAICKFLAQSKEPLLLAAVANLVPLYREVNHYPYLQAETIEGSPDSIKLHELHRRAWEIVLPGFLAHEERSLAKCAVQAARNRAANGLHEILNAAHAGRIETLLIAPALMYWGSFDPDTGQCRLLEQHAPGSEDLLNVAAIETLRHGGNVFVANLSNAGIQEPAAALFKFNDVATRTQVGKTSRSKAHPSA